jgi:transcriptional regulator with XRE-family HTH domain
MVIDHNRLKELRMLSGLSLRDLAAKCDISKTALFAYEQGERHPKFETVEALCDVFNCDIDYLTGRSDIKNAAANLLGYSSLEEAYNAGADLSVLLKQTAPTELELSEGEQMLIKLFRQIPPEQQPSAIEMLRSALKVAGIPQ